jgi:DNA polymerase III epsilon subunit-like protein
MSLSQTAKDSASQLSAKSRQRVLVFDTETSGLPNSRTQNYRDLKQFQDCRLLSISWIVFQDGELENENYHIVKHEKPHSKVVNGAEHINGITRQAIKSKGVVWSEVMDKLMSDLATCRYAVAHNVEFDRMVLLTEAFRYGKTDWLETLENQRYHCTKEMGTVVRDDGSREPWPRLDALYMKLFDSKMRGAHHALTDTRATAKCYFEMLERKKKNGGYLECES